jgi:hypothetical protein
MGIINVAIVKAKSTIEIETDRLPEAVYLEALTQGLKVLMNRGNTKITKTTYPKPEELAEKAMEAANAMRENLYAGKIRIMGAKSDNKVPGVVMTEARRIARNLVKDELKRQGVKVSYVEASEITKAANALIAADEGIIKQAEDAIKSREDQAAKVKAALGDLKSTVPVSQKKMAAAEKAKADNKAKAATVLSAAQAGKTQGKTLQANS